MGGCQCSNANPENNIDVPNKEVNEEDKKKEENNEDNEKKEEEKKEETQNNLNTLNNNNNRNLNDKSLSIVKEESKEKSSNVNESNLNQNDLKLKSNNQKIKYKIENYPNDALNMINKIRNNPIEFIPEIEEAIKHIKTEQNKLIYSGNLKVALNKGEEIFKETIEILKQIPPMESLIFDNNIAI